MTPGAALQWVQVGSAFVGFVSQVVRLLRADTDAGDACAMALIQRRRQERATKAAEAARASSQTTEAQAHARGAASAWGRARRGR